MVFQLTILRSDQTRQNPTEIHIAPKASFMLGVSHRVPEDLVTGT